jgi:hypothetical protein
MTDAQIEAAARELCRLRGLDPDECADWPDESPPLGWRAQVPEVRSFAEVGTAIAAALAEKKPKRAARARE